MAELTATAAFSQIELATTGAPTDWVSGSVLNEQRVYIKTTGESSIVGLRIDANPADLSVDVWTATDANGANAQVEATLTGVGSNSLTLYKRLYYGASVSGSTAPTDGNEILVRFVV